MRLLYYVDEYTMYPWQTWLYLQSVHLTKTFDCVYVNNTTATLPGHIVLVICLSELQPALLDVLNMQPPGLTALLCWLRSASYPPASQQESLRLHLVAKDIEFTLNDVLGEDENLVNMHLTHLATTGWMMSLISHNRTSTSLFYCDYDICWCPGLLQDVLRRGWYWTSL